VRDGPSAPITAARTSAAAPTPISVERQPRVTPTARTIVSASTISTALARKAARKRKAVVIAAPAARPAQPLCTDRRRRSGGEIGDSLRDGRGELEPVAAARRADDDRAVALEHEAPVLGGRVETGLGANRLG